MSPSSQIPDADITAAWEHADQRKGHGYIYAIDFTSPGPERNVVKVGQTIQPAKRFVAHARDSRSKYLHFRTLWLSEPHININATERALIAFCKDRWPLVHGKEWFADADFDAVTEFATQLRKVQFTERHRKAHAAYFLTQRSYPVEAACAAIGLTLEEIEA